MGGCLCHKRLGHDIWPSIIPSIVPHQLFTFTCLLQYYYCPWCRSFRVLISLFLPISYYPSFSLLVENFNSTKSIQKRSVCNLSYLLPYLLPYTPTRPPINPTNTPIRSITTTAIPSAIPTAIHTAYLMPGGHGEGYEAGIMRPAKPN